MISKVYHKTHRLLGLPDDSSEDSLALPLPLESDSRERLFLEDRVARVEIESKEITAEESVALCSLSCSFCFAAFTLALERRALDPAEEEEGSIDCCWDIWGETECENALELLVAS